MICALLYTVQCWPPSIITCRPLCPTPGQIAQACGAEGKMVLGTIFPMPAGQGTSWNRSLVRSIAAAVATEVRASGGDRGFSPELQVVSHTQSYSSTVLERTQSYSFTVLEHTYPGVYHLVSRS